MKRIISLVLAIALLCSFVPVALAETTTPVVSYELGTADPRTATAEDGTAISYYRVPVSVKNNSENDLLISSYECYLKFEGQRINVVDTQGIELKDGTYLEAVEKGENGTVKEWNKPTVGLLTSGDCIGAVLANDANTRALKIKPGNSVTLIYVNFTVAEDAENGPASISFAKDAYRKDGSLAVNFLSYYDADTKTTTDYFEKDGTLDCSSTTTIEVTGATPVLARVELVADDDNLEIPYGTEKEITLKAFSKKSTDVTSFVTFEIEEYTGDGLAINGNKLTVSAENPANVSTYTVTATANGTDCTDGENVETASFKITPKKITDPKVAITGFVKGNDIFRDLKIEPKDTAGLTSDGVTCYEGPEVTDRPVTGKFKAATTYTLAITLDAMDNYELGEGILTYTINGGEEMTTPIVEKNDFPTPYYQAVVTATTEALDSPTLELDELTATYGDLLSDLTPTGKATFNEQTVDGTFEWSTEYGTDTKVGDAGENTFNVVFTPNNTDLYATVTGTVTVTVAQKEIDITGMLNTWSADEFTYDGEWHSVELKIDDALVGIVEVEKYTDVTKARGAGEYTASAWLKLVDPANYKFNEDNVLTREHTWKIKRGTINNFEKNLPLLYGPAQRISITPEFLDLPEGESFTVKLREAGGLVSWDTSGTLYVKRDTTEADVGKTGYVKLQYESDNYYTFYVTINVEFISKEDAGLTITGIPESLVYGESIEWSYDVTTPGENGHISGSVTPAGILNNAPHKLTAIGVGEATVTITYSSDTTYAQKEFTITVTPKPLTAAVSHEAITYGDAAPTDGYTVEFNGLVNGDKITDYTVGTEYTVGKPAGTYKLTCVLGDSVKNYTLAAEDITGELVVNKKELTDGDVTVTVLGETPVYDGSEKKPAVGVKYGETTLAPADYTVSYSNNINAGTASVTVTSTDNSSYKFTATKNFTIAPAAISGAVIADIDAVTYDTKAHTPEVTVTFNNSTLEADKDYEVEYTNNVNAGTATVTVTAKENGNFTGTASKTFTINKANLTLSPYTISSLCTETEVKTETLPSNFFLADEKETGFSIALEATEKADDIFAENGAPAVVKGENKITFQLKEVAGEAVYTVTVKPTSDNYNAGSYALTISAYDKSNISGSISFPDGSAVYTGYGLKYENATVSGYSGALRYGYTPDASTGASLDASGLPLTVGSYTVSATISTSSVYGYKTATFTITKATPNGTPGYTKVEERNKTLADAKLTVGTIRPAGTIAWDLPETTVLEDGKAYAWTFTPNDTHNYTILTGTLIPYVDNGMDYIPGVIGGNTGSTGSFTFHDVNRYDYYYDAVKWAAENGIASGTSRYSFSPNAVCTRAQTLTFLWRAAGSPLVRYRVCPFTDVKPTDYYYNAVLWAVEQGITTGLNATTFGPDVTVDRGQVATFLYRVASASAPAAFNPFTDVKPTAYNYNAILWAYDNRITTGTSDTTFSPDAYCTRAQIVTFLYRYYQGR